MVLLKNVLIVVAMYAVAWPFLAPLWTVTEAPVSSGTQLLVLLSAIANVVVIVYHYAVPPHPKFLMVPFRRAILRVHITSGTIELFAGLLALYAAPNPTAARVMAAAAILLHVPSAFAQTPIVFGARAIMRPGYLMCIGLHLFCALKLWLEPSSAFWAASTFLVFNVYVWCRLYYFVFDKLGLFAGARYSVAILAAGLTTTPGVLGPSAILVLALGCAVYMVLARLLFVKDAAGWADLVRERARDSALPEEVRSMFVSGAKEDDRDAAQAFFSALDRDGDGALSRQELKELLAQTTLPVTVTARFLDTKLGSAASLDRQGFQATLWPLKEVRERAWLVKALASAKSDRDKARLVFDRLDVDRDGLLSRLELEALLTEWSLPVKEADRWLRLAQAHDKGALSFDDFMKHLRPVWRFIFYDVVEAQHGKKEDMIVRAVTAARDSGAQARVRQAVYRELAANVPFFAAAGDALLDELSQSLAEEKLADGRALFEEGARGDTLYIVRSGQLRVTRGGERLGEVGPGDYVGEGALLSPDATRAAAVTAVGAASVLAMTKGTFEALRLKHPALDASVRALHQERHEERRLVELQRAMQRELVGRVPFLIGAGPEVIAELVAGLSRLEAKRDQVVFSEGEFGDAFFLIGRGVVHALRNEQVVAEFSAGNWFGEGALLSGEPRTATVIVAEDAVLYRLDKARFDAALAKFPQIERAIHDSHLSRRAQLVKSMLAGRLLRRVPFLKQASADHIDALAKVLVPKRAEAGDVLVREGDVGTSLFLVAKGAVAVQRDGVELAELAEGSFFGERALLKKEPRAATVVALESTELLELEGQAIDALSSQWPELKQQLAIPPPRPSRPPAPHAAA